MPDIIQLYAESNNWTIQPRTIFVEGTTDVDLFELAAKLKRKKTNANLLDNIGIIAAGEGDRGGTPGVVRELITLRNISRNILLPNGKPKYRFIGLFDNDHAGRLAIKEAKRIDTSVLEFKDVFRLHPMMPTNGNLDVKTLQKTFEKHNTEYKGLDWEIEDFLPDSFIMAFLDGVDKAISNEKTVNGKTHRNYTRDGKARLHQFVKKYAILEDLEGIVKLLTAFRFYFGL